MEQWCIGAVLYAKASLKPRAGLEHELRVPGHPIRLGIAACQHERDLREVGRRCLEDSDSMVGGSRDRPVGSTDYRFDERPHLVLARAAPALFHGRGYFVLPRFVSHA